MKSKAINQKIISNIEGYESKIILTLVDIINKTISTSGDVYRYDNLEGREFDIPEYVYLNQYDILDSVGFIYHAVSDKSPKIQLLDFTEVSLVGPTSISHRLSIPADVDDHYASIIKTVTFPIKIRNKYTVEITADIIIEQIAKPKEFSDLFNRMITILLIDESAFKNQDFEISEDSVDVELNDPRRFSLRYGVMEFIEKLKDVLVKYTK